jgi:hypothetical protein
MATIRGGDKLQSALARLTINIKRPGTVQIGFLEGAIYPAGSRASLRARYKKKRSTGALKGSKGGLSVAMIAAIQEFGAPRAGIPPRPFMRNMVAAKQGEWPKAIAGLLKQTNYDGRKTLQLIGEAIAGQLRQSIKDTNAPPLKPATIKAKGSSKPLVDSGHLLASVSYQVIGS